jgi:hypothetical protein
VETGPLSDLLSPSRIAAIDEGPVLRYNQRASDHYQLRIDLGPCAFEGDVDRAPIVLLLANPGFDKTSTAADHAFHRDGWPLSGLHRDAPPGLRKWWLARLGPLIDAHGAQRVAQRVACLQVTPWASTGFDASLRLPSRTALLDAATSCSRRGAVLIVMRAERLWLEATELATYTNRFRVNSWRSSYVTPGNLKAAAWSKVLGAVGVV